MKEIYDFLVTLDQTGFAYAIFLLCFLVMTNFAFKAQAEVIRLRKLLKQAMK